MDNLSPIVSVLSMIVAAIGITYAVIKASFATARYEDAERRIDGLRGDLNDAEAREKRMQTSIAELSTRVKALEDENTTLRSFVPTQDELEEVKRLAQQHYDESTSFYNEFRAGAAVILKQLWEAVDVMKRAIIRQEPS